MTRLGVAGIVMLAVVAPATAAVHHALDVRLDPAARTLHAVDRITLDGAAVEAVTLPSSLRIERVTVDGRPVGVTRDGARVPLALDAASHVVEVTYGGTLAPLAADVSDVPAAGPEGAFLPGGWYPAVDERPFTWTLDVAVPPGQRAVAPGRLVTEDAPRGRASFASDGPTEALALFAGRWEVTERMHRGKRLRTYFTPELRDDAAAYLEKTAAYLDRYEDWIGPYAFSGFAIVAAPIPVGLGFPGLTYVGASVLRLPFIRDTSLGHEVLHCWWGNGVFIDASGGNWAEGLTTFMADYTYAEDRGADAARDLRQRWLRELAVLPPALDLPIASFVARGHVASQAIGYHKTALVLLMLRDAIGVDAFDRALRGFWSAHRFRAAAWGDLEAAFATASGRDLAWFFAQWIRRAGAPVLALHDVRADGAAAAFVVAQGAPVWRLDLPVAVEADAVVRERVTLDGRSHGVRIPTAGPPRAVAVDPDARVVRRLDPSEIPPLLRAVAFESGAATVLATHGADARKAAVAAATAFLEGAPHVVAAPPPTGPLLVVGTTADVEATLHQLGLDGVPPVLRCGTGRAWAVRRDGGPLVVVAGDDAVDLAALAGPLPHYGGESFVVFDGRHATDRGQWPPTASPLLYRLDGGAHSLVERTPGRSP